MTTNRLDSRSVCCSGPEGTMAALLAGQAGQADSSDLVLKLTTLVFTFVPLISHVSGIWILVFGASGVA